LGSIVRRLVAQAGSLRHWQQDASATNTKSVEVRV